LQAPVPSKGAVRREGIWNTIVHGSLLTLAFLLLFLPLHLKYLDARFLPEAGAIALCGFVLTAAGLAFAIWARLQLGRNWSSRVTIMKDHCLIRQGPYRLVRHPIYSGLLLAMAGTAIGYGRVLCLAGPPLAFLAFWIKARTEEEFMITKFGAQYIQYQQEVKAFIPGLV
jgi:protein-S-isoprenylcysteine O-methyltransferase Ste14